MKYIFPIFALLFIVVAGCDQNEPQSNRLKASDFAQLNGNWHYVVTDTKTGREFLVRGNGIIEIQPKAEHDAR